MGFPGISGDGNWIAFTAMDHNRKPGLYLMHSKGGDPRFITPVANTSYGSYTDVSPDGSLIVYTEGYLVSGESNVYVVNTNGGAPQKIGKGFMPRFRPDGLRIGFIRGFMADRLPSGKIEFWSSAKDGNDRRSEFVDTIHIGLGGNWFVSSFSYSPDGKEIAWIRTFPGNYSEIVIHNLETGQELQATSEKKVIDEVAWAGEDHIAYTSNRSGVLNVWMVSAGGGSSVQITRESMPVLGVKCSADGKKLLYTLSNEVTDVFTVNIDEKRAHQITFRDEYQSMPQFSPDGKLIAFVVGGWYNSPSHLFLMDRDGGNRRQLTFGEECVILPMWSPDGRRVAYAMREVSEPADSFRTHIMEPSNPSSQKFIGRGTPQPWLDSVRFQLLVDGTVYVTSVDRAPLTRVCDDSISGNFVRGDKYIVFRDLHQGRNQNKWWVVDGKTPRGMQNRTAKPLNWPFGSFKGDEAGGRAIYTLSDAGVIWRMELPHGKPERIKADLLGVDASYNFSPSWDGKELLIVKKRSSPKIIMLENVFR